MSDEGERTCPLCAEEMDLTDQQLKPCKCGYQICVWCWHHIMDMAEKDDTEGRCPACRTPYNKEKIVATTANCERLVSEINMEKKVKSQKGKIKSSEGRKQLSSVRVVQRNLVYIVGLPLNLADEDLLQCKEYFGQYGKVLKVSISRTAAGSIQHFANSTCSVYITYSKEDEAIRCIQSVHGFILEERPLKACFGTTKYCHAWLRNMPCSNPDCLYLHEMGSLEDSFTKDEIISSYTRSKLQQITGGSNSTQRHSGNVLPPPLDGYSSNISASSVKSISKMATYTTNSASNSRVSPPNSSSGRSAALPAGASWGSRASNNQPSSTSSNRPFEHKSDSYGGPVTFSTTQANLSQVPIQDVMVQDKSKLKALEPAKRESSDDHTTIAAHSSSASSDCSTSTKDRDRNAIVPPNTIKLVDPPRKSFGPALEKDPAEATSANIEIICSNIESISIDSNTRSQNGYVDHIRGQLMSQTPGTAVNSSDEVCLISVDLRSGIQSQVVQVGCHGMDDDLLSFNNQRLKDPEVANNRNPVSDFFNSFHMSKHSDIHSLKHDNVLESSSVEKQSNLMNSAPTDSIMSGHPGNQLNGSFDLINNLKYSPPLPRNTMLLLHTRESEGATSGHSAAVEVEENSIISNILSMDFDPWDESLTSPQNMAKFFGESDQHQRSFGLPSSWKIQNCNQSRFSFAREEEFMSQTSDGRPSTNYIEQAFNHRTLGKDFSNSNNFHLEKLPVHNGYSVFDRAGSDSFTSCHSPVSSDKLAGTRTQISAPPGFSVPSRAPPPGFPSHDRIDQSLRTLSGNHMLSASTLLRNQYHASPNGNSPSNGDIEFMDPAILAVGKGTLSSGLNSSSLDMRSGFSPEFSTVGETRFQSLLERSLPQHQNQRFPNLGDSFSLLGDSYGISSIEQTITNNQSPISQFAVSQPRNAARSNPQRDGWNEMQSGNNLGMVEILRNESLGFNKFFGGHEDPKIRVPSSGHLYSGTFGI